MMPFDYKCGPHSPAITILRLILLPPDQIEMAAAAAAAVSPLRCEGALIIIWMILNLLPVTMAVPAALQSITTEVTDNIPSYFNTNLPTRGLYSTFSKCNWNTLTYSPDFFWSTISTRQCNAAGVRCIRKLGWWSWNRWASPTWAQGRPQGDHPLCLCSVSG